MMRAVFKKFAVLPLVCAASLHLAAAERLQISVNIAGDNDAKIEILDKSKNVRPNKQSTGFLNKKPGRAHVFVVPLKEGKFEVMLKLRLTGDGNFCFSGIGWGKEKGTFQNIDCLSLELNGEKFIPKGKQKVLTFSRWKKLTGKQDIALAGEEVVTFRATFRKSPANGNEKKRSSTAKGRK